MAVSHGLRCSSHRTQREACTALEQNVAYLVSVPCRGQSSLAHPRLVLAVQDIEESDPHGILHGDGLHGEYRMKRSTRARKRRRRTRLELPILLHKYS